MVTRRHIEVATGLFGNPSGCRHGLWQPGERHRLDGFRPVRRLFPVPHRHHPDGARPRNRRQIRPHGRRRAPANLEAQAAGGAVALHEPTGLDERFLEDGALGRIASVFVPTAISAALIPWLGVYLSGALFLVFSMMTLGKVGLVKAATISVATMAVFFVTFEFWFQVPLAKGVVMPLLGIY